METIVAKEIVYLTALAVASETEYIYLLNSATKEQIKAVLECLLNQSLFDLYSKSNENKQLPAVYSKIIQYPSKFKLYMQRHRIQIQASLCQIIITVLLGEFAEVCSYDGESDESH